MEKKFILKIKYKTLLGLKSTINWTILDHYPSKEEIATEVKLFMDSNDKKESDIADLYIKETYNAKAKKQRDFSDTFLGKTFTIIAEILF